MLQILRSMIKEEWRIHSSLFGGSMFALFPIIMMVITFLGSISLPYLKEIIPTSQMLVILNYTFLLFGLSVGAFGLLGKEVMNRRFGQASLLAYSSRTLPVSERNILANFIVKDIIYYFFLWILPFGMGFAFASFFISVSLTYTLSILSIATLSFLMGLSVSFFLSTIYAHSAKILISILAATAVAVTALASYYGTGFASLAQVLSFSLIPSFNQITLSLLIIVIPTTFSLAFIKVDYPIRKRTFNNSLDPLTGLFRFSKYSTFMSKDFLDFKRSEGGLGKIIFSFIIPLFFIWILLSIFMKFVPILNPFIVFSMFLGIMSSSFYNWFTEFDLFNSYAFLPIKVSTMMRSKINSYMIINIVSVAILISAMLLTGQEAFFLPSLMSFLAISSYTLSITVYLVGLNPNILLYNAKIFSEYLALISPLLLALIFLSFFPVILAFSIVLVPISYVIIKKSYEKWDKVEQPHF
jgi:hypothetical protein